MTIVPVPASMGAGDRGLRVADKAKELAIRRAIVEVYVELARLGMNAVSSGNVSVRFAGGMLITPTGCTAEGLRAADIVQTGFDGSSKAKLRPSSEWAMHAEIYQRVADANCVVHTHADNCVALSCLRRPLPAFHYMIQVFGGSDVPCVDYFPFGTHELGRAAGKALENRKACLMANHGMISRGATIRAAFDAAVLLETMCRQYLTASAVGDPLLLSAADMAIVARQFEDYGRQPRSPVKRRWSLP
jgi:L-fuculose-phosphate aldolase